ncbi:MAG: hypothetical protein Q9M39_04415 [Sulfurovum sp.]|nr:hypothetical protein [Sulfurovum sp.]
MEVTVEKLDDINLIISGTIDSKMIEDKFASLKEKSAKKVR